MLNKSIIQIGFKLISAFLLIGGLLAQGNVSGTVTDETVSQRTSPNCEAFCLWIKSTPIRLPANLKKKKLREAHNLMGGYLFRNNHPD